MAHVPYLSTILRFTEDMRRENIKSLSLYLIMSYLKQNHSEVSADYHSGLLNTLIELCRDAEEPGDAFMYIKILYLLIQSREYFWEDLKSAACSDERHKRIQDIHTLLFQLRGQFSGKSVARIDHLISEAQCQIVLSGVLCNNLASALHFWEIFYTAARSQSSNKLSSQLKQILDFQARSDGNLSREPKIKATLLNQHSPEVLHGLVVAFISANLSDLCKRCPMFNHVQEYNYRKQSPDFEEESKPSLKDLFTKAIDDHSIADSASSVLATGLGNGEVGVDIESLSDGQQLEFSATPPETLPDSSTKIHDAALLVAPPTPPTEPGRGATTPPESLPSSHADSASNVYASELEKGKGDESSKVIHDSREVDSTENRQGSAKISDDVLGVAVEGSRSRSGSPSSASLRSISPEPSGHNGHSHSTSPMTTNQSKQSREEIESSSDSSDLSSSDASSSPQPKRHARQADVDPQSRTSSEEGSSPVLHARQIVTIKSSRRNQSNLEQSGCSVSPVKSSHSSSPAQSPRQSSGHHKGAVSQKGVSRGKKPSSKQSSRNVSPVHSPKQSLRLKGTVSSKGTLSRNNKLISEESGHTISPVLSPRHSARAKDAILPEVMPKRLSRKHQLEQQSERSVSPVLQSRSKGAVSPAVVSKRSSRKARYGLESDHSVAPSRSKGAVSPMVRRSGRRTKYSSQSDLSVSPSRPKRAVSPTVRRSSRRAKYSSQSDHSVSPSRSKGAVSPAVVSKRSSRRARYGSESDHSVSPSRSKGAVSPAVVSKRSSRRARYGSESDHSVSPSRPKGAVSPTVRRSSRNSSQSDLSVSPSRSKGAVSPTVRRSSRNSSQSDLSVSPSRSKGAVSPAVVSKRSSRRARYGSESDHSVSPSRSKGAGSPAVVSKRSSRRARYGSESDHSVSPSRSKGAVSPAVVSKRSSRRARYGSESDLSVAPSRSNGAVSPAVVSKRSSRRAQYGSESDRSVSPSRPKGNVSPTVRRSNRNSSQSDLSVSPSRSKGTVSLAVVSKRSSRRAQYGSESDHSVSPSRSKGAVSPTVRRSGKRTKYSSQSDRRVSPVHSPKHSARAGDISPKALQSGENKSSSEQSDHRISSILSLRGTRQEGTISPKVTPQSSSRPGTSTVTRKRTADAMELWTSDEDSQDGGHVPKGSESKDLEASPSNRYGRQSIPRRRGINGEGNSSPRGKGRYRTPEKEMPGLIRKVRRSLSNERRTMRKGDTDIYDFSDDERTPASKLPVRLPRIEVRPLEEFVPRPQTAQPPIQKPVYSGVRKGKGIVFSNEESEFLRAGIKRFGYGNWAAILKAYPFHPSRKGSSLKDRARNMQGRVQKH